MRAIAFFLLLFISHTSFSQNLKKKYYGTYSGIIAPYALDAGGEVVTVKGSQVSFTLNESLATQTIDGITATGKWRLISTKSDYYEIGFTPENAVVLQKYFLFKKGKKMERDGIYPQPDCILIKEG